MSGPAADFPGRFPVLIGTRAFAVNTSYEQFRRQSTHHDTIPSSRESIDLTDVPGEGTINTEGLWRRGAVSWHHGAGQLYLDRKDSDDFRFLDSKGVDIWYQNQLSLLPDVVKRLDDTTPTAYNWQTTQVIGAVVFILRANVNPTGTCTVEWTTDYSTYNTPSGAPSEILEIAADGTNLYLSSPSGVYILEPVSGSFSGATWAQVITDPVDHIFACNFGGGKRIICTGSGTSATATSTGNQSSLYDITGASPASPIGLNENNSYLIMTHVDPQWDWLDATTGEANIYVCGVSGSPASGAQPGASTVFQISIETNNNGVFTAATNLTLTQGTVAYQLNAGEFCGTVFAYAGFIFLGTNLGIRCTRPSTVDDPTTAQGLISGPTLPNLLHPIQAPFQPYVGNFVSGIVGYGPWVWFSWPQFDDESWGLGRLDLRTFIADLQPAYASDLMVPSTSTSDNSHHTLNWCPITNGPLISVPQQGLYTQDFGVTNGGAKYVASGSLLSGRITWGIPDMKTVAQANWKGAPSNTYAPYDTGGGGASLNVAYDGGSFGSLAPLAPNTQANPPVLVSPLTSAEEVEVEVVLTPASGIGTDDIRPFFSRWTAKALPQVVSGRLIFVAIMLYTENDMNNDLDYSDPYGDYAYLENLRLSQEIITYKEGNPGAVTYDEATCVVQELYWMPQQRRDTADSGFIGDLVVTLKTIVG